MAMPKKRVRKIVVGGITYKYVIKPFSIGVRYGGSITIEKPDGTYISKGFDDLMTPSMVRQIIEENK